MLVLSDFSKVIDNKPAPNSSGYFKELMDSFNRYIGEEFKANRLTGAQYAEVYLGGMQAAMNAALDYTKHMDMVYLQNEKLELERELNETQKALVKAQTQAFKAKHNKEMAKLVFDVVTIGVTQEQMNILAGPNPIFGGLTPATEFAKAVWVDEP